MSWILLIFWASYQSSSVTKVSFDTEAGCKKAMAAIVDPNVNSMPGMFATACVKVLSNTRTNE